MTRDEIIENLTELNNLLIAQGVSAEIGLVGGAVMCLVFQSRSSTDDIDALFRPAPPIRFAATIIAERKGLKQNWLNDGVKGYLSENNDMYLFNRLSNLQIYAASAEYMFAMKALSCRLDEGNDKDDIQFLINYLGIISAEQALEILSRYYPKSRILPKTQYMLMEMFQ